MDILNSSGNQNKMKMTAKTEELMDSHPNLDSAPTNAIFENEEDCAYMLGQNAFHDANSQIAPENDIMDHISNCGTSKASSRYN